MEKEYYQVFHLEPRQQIAYGLNRHITRQQFVIDGGEVKVAVWVPDNADPERTTGNVEIISRTSTDSEGRTVELTLQQLVDRRIREAGIEKRKGQNTAMEIIFSGTHERMLAMSRAELLEWADAILRWARETWGEENVVYACLHVDETTPHIHMIVVPIVSGRSRRTLNRQKKMEELGRKVKKYNIDDTRLRLCMNDVYTTGKLYWYHDHLAKEVNEKYELHRGVQAEPGSKKTHTKSIEHNRRLEREAMEKKALIEELQADYDVKKDAIEEEIQQYYQQLNHLSSSVNEEKDKLAEAKSRTKQAEVDAAKAEERLASQQKTISKNKTIIDKQVADFYARREEHEKTKTDITANKETIEQQERTIAENEALIRKQEVVKSSTVISNDELERQVLEKRRMLEALGEEEARLKRGILDVRMDQAMITDAVKKELQRLRAIEDEFKKTMNSPELLRQHIESLKEESMRRSIAEVLRYYFRQPVEIIRFTADATPQGKDIFVKFTIAANPTRYVGRITPSEDLMYTDMPLQSVDEIKDKEKNHQKLWLVKRNLSDVRKEREIEDTKSKFSVKLSLLTGKTVQVQEYIEKDKNYVFLCADRTAFFVKADGHTTSGKVSDEQRGPKGELRSVIICSREVEEGNIYHPGKGLKDKNQLNLRR